MTSFTYQCVAGEYRIIFETDSNEAYSRMEEAAQSFIDWWREGRFEDVPVADVREEATP